MSQKQVEMRIEVDRETDSDFVEWSSREGRSKRRHVAILLRKLNALRKHRPEELRRLGLIDDESITVR